MKVLIKLFANYREGRFKEQEFDLSENTKAQDIIKMLKIDEEKLPIGGIFVNSVLVDSDFVPKDGDKIAIFPKIGGG